MITTHPDDPTGTSQCDRILALLRERAGQWVPLPDLALVSGSMAVHSRIADLRKRGEQIEQRNERRGRMIHSSYKLTQRLAQPELF